MGVMIIRPYLNRQTAQIISNNNNNNVLTGSASLQIEAFSTTNCNTSPVELPSGFVIPEIVVNPMTGIACRGDTIYRQILLDNERVYIDLDSKEIHKLISSGQTDKVRKAIRPFPVIGVHVLYFQRLAGQIVIGLISERPGKKFGLPGGKVEKGECLQRALYREMEEEIPKATPLCQPRMFMCSPSPCKEFLCYFTIVERYEPDLIYVSVPHLNQDCIEPYVARIVVAAQATTNRAPCGKLFLEGSFNPYGNGMIVFFFMFLVCCYSQSWYNIFYVGDRDCKGVGIVPPTSQCVNIAPSQWNGFESVAWYPFPGLTNSTTTLFYTTDTCINSARQDDASVNSCINVGDSSFSVNFSAAPTFAPTSAPTPTPAPTAASPAAKVCFGFACSTPCVSISIQQCGLLNGWFIQQGINRTYGSVRWFYQNGGLLLAAYADNLCSSGAILTIAPINVTTSCLTAINPVYGHRIASYANVSFTYPTFPPTQSPTRAPTPPPTAPVCTSIDVNVVGFAEQTAPLWVSDSTSNAPVINFYNCHVDMGYDWAESSISKNKKQHALNGNTLNPLATAYDPNTRSFVNLFASDPDVTFDDRSVKSSKRNVPPHRPKPVVSRAPKDDFISPNITARYLKAAARLGPVPLECVRFWVGDIQEWSLPPRVNHSQLSDDIPKSPPARPRPSNHSASTVQARKTKEERSEQLEQVVSRLILKLTTYDLALEWIMTSHERVSDDLCLLLLSKLNATQNTQTASAFLFTCCVNKRPTYERLSGLSQFDQFLNKIIETNEFREWMKNDFSIFTDEISDDVEWKKVRAGDHSREMHSTNGNIAPRSSDRKKANKRKHAENGNTTRQQFPNDMKDILSHKRTKALFTEKESISGKSIANPIEEVQQQSGVQSIAGVNLSDVPREMPIRGGIISANNQYNARRDLNHPEALMFPRNVRNGAAAALINSNKRLRLYGIGLQRRMNKFGLSISTHGAVINEIVARSGNIRPDQTTAFGFFTSDMVNLIKQQGDDNGDSMVSWTLKMHLYSLSIAWSSPVTCLPMSCEVSKFDAFTKYQGVDQPVLGYNDSPVFGEDCGNGANPVFPYTTNVPMISFHASTATVPLNAVRYFIRPALLQQNDRGGNSLNIALILMGLLPYPCGLHTVTVETVDTADGNAEDQRFIPFSAQVVIPGEVHIAIILPVFGSGPPPTTQALANSRVIVQPTFGPTNYGGNVANALVDVCWDTANLTIINAAAYLGTWLAMPNSPVDLTTINRMMKQVVELTGRGKDTQFAYELAIVNSVRYPPLVECAPPANTIPAVNSDLSAAQHNFFCLKPFPMVADVPEEEQTWDFYIPDLNPNFWNKLMTGTYTAVSDGTIFPMTNYLTDASPRILQYAIHTVRDYAITGEYIFQYHRQSRLMWNSAFTQNNMVTLMNTMRKYFAASSVTRPNNAIVQSAAGKQVAVMHWKVNGCAPACDMWGLSLWSYINSPRTGFSGVWSVAAAELDTPIPSILPDIWSQLFTHARTLAFAPFLSPLKRMTGIQDPGCQITALGAGSYTIPASIDSQAREVGLGSVPLIDDVEVFNARIVFHSMVSNLYTLDGAVWNNSTVTAGNLVSQKYVVLDYTVPDLTRSTLPASKTNWMPYNTATGLRLLVGVTAANGANLMSQYMDGRAFTSLQCWQFNNITIMPNTIIGTVGNTDDGLWDNDDDEVVANLKDSSDASPLKPSDPTLTV